MEISFLPVDLARWDLAPAGDLFVVGVFSDVRPPRGPAGLVDWRLCGAVSDGLRQGRFDNAEEPAAALGTVSFETPRLPWRSVMAVALGPLPAFTEERFRAALRTAFEEARRLGTERLACALPGRELGRIAPDRAFELLLAVAEQERSVDGASVSALTVIDAPSATKVMADIVTRSAWARLAAPRRPTLSVG